MHPNNITAPFRTFPWAGAQRVARTRHLLALLRVRATSRSTPPEWGSIGSIQRVPPHVRPMGVHRTCGEPDQIKMASSRITSQLFFVGPTKLRKIPTRIMLPLFFVPAHERYALCDNARNVPDDVRNTKMKGRERGLNECLMPVQPILICPPHGPQWPALATLTSIEPAGDRTPWRARARTIRRLTATAL